MLNKATCKKSVSVDLSAHPLSLELCTVSRLDTPPVYTSQHEPIGQMRTYRYAMCVRHKCNESRSTGIYNTSAMLIIIDVKG